ncbi:MAG: cell cycle RNA binding protein whi3 [Alyxoria varia]|nr:MAG: cell cycle RNA binding protein whi3 [Alyxoria varia]
MAFGTSSPPHQPTNGPFHPRFNTSPNAERSSFDKNSPPHSGKFSSEGQDHVPTILLRHLPSGMTYDALNNMLIFAEDKIDTVFIDIPDERGFVSAIARFRNPEGAYEARNKLHGKPNSTNEASIVVEVLPNTNGFGHGASTHNPEPSLQRHVSNPHPLHRSSTNGSTHRPSRYFQSMADKLAPIKIPNEREYSDPESIFSQQQSPHASGYRDGMRVTGKSMINEDDDETRELLKDPVAYAKNDRSNSIRRSNSQIQPPVSRLNNLSLNTSHNASNDTSLASPTGFGSGISRQMPPLGSPASEMSPTGLTNGMPPISPTSSYGLGQQQMSRHPFPPANPADQNPPCNTLYVGNLPVDTSEDELKAMFSKQRGYKRLCFRTKHNGPMCFVEFEDVSFATKALNDLYGQPLHNSVKGGIRLSFSKNPLGVRAGQGNNMNPGSPLASPNSGSGISGAFSGPGFSTASGPPPGLSIPPGLTSPGSAGASASQFASAFGPNSPPLPTASSRGHQSSYMGGAGLNPIGGGYSDGMNGR